MTSQMAGPLAGLPERAPNSLRVGFAAETEPSAEEATSKLTRCWVLGW